MDEKKRAQKKRGAIYDQFYNLKSVESAEGLTGLVPTAPKSGDELSAYAELEGMPSDLDDGD